MTERVSKKDAPEAHRAMLALGQHLAQSSIEPELLHLVYLRVSQVNGCAYCVDLHHRDAVKIGHSERKLASLVVWQEAPFFSARERAALGWAEALTRLIETHAPDEIYARAAAEFGGKELAELSYAIAHMNAMNRIGVGFRMRADAGTERAAA
jgi:AhpD family alkylhydroperoxidase